MKIAVARLREGHPEKVHQTYDPKALDLEFVDLRYAAGLVLDGSVEKTMNVLTFRGKMTSRVLHICGRCLKEVGEEIDRPFELVYDVKGREEVDTLDDLREILILDHPIRYLCDEDCRGLCPQCGADLNEGPCSCGA